MPAEKDNSGKQISFDVVACLLAALNESNVTIGAQHFKLMAQIDPARTEGGYQHFFRPIKARAKEITDKMAKGELGDLSTPTKKGGKNAGAKTNGGTKTPAKRGRKAQSETEQVDDDEELTSAKKVKKEPSPAASELDAKAASDTPL